MRNSFALLLALACVSCDTRSNYNYNSPGPVVMAKAEFKMSTADFDLETASESDSETSQLPFYAGNERQAKSIFTQFCIPIAGKEIKYLLHEAGSRLEPQTLVEERTVTSPPQQE